MREGFGERDPGFRASAEPAVSCALPDGYQHRLASGHSSKRERFAGVLSRAVAWGRGPAGTPPPSPCHARTRPVGARFVFPHPGSFPPWAGGWLAQPASCRGGRRRESLNSCEDEGRFIYERNAR